MADAQRELGVASGCGDIDVVDAVRVVGCGRDGRVDDSVKVLFLAIEGEEESALRNEADRSGDVALVDAALLKGLAGGEILLRVQGGIAEEEIELTVVFLLRLAGDDFNLAAAGAVVAGGVGVLV